MEGKLEMPKKTDPPQKDTASEDNPTCSTSKSITMKPSLRRELRNPKGGPQMASAPQINKHANSNELKPNIKNQDPPNASAQTVVPAYTELQVIPVPLSLEASSASIIHQSKTSPGNAHSQIFIQQVPPEILQRLIVPTVDGTNPYSIPVDKPIYRELFQRMISDNSLSTKTTAITEDLKKLNLREQLTEFTSAQSLTQNEAYLRWQFISDLYFLLKQQRPQCEVYVFGSLITGLADESSDIDVFVDLLGNSDQEDSSLSAEDFNSQRQAIFKTVEEILGMAKCPHDPCQKFNTDLLALPTCKVPIIKLVHHARINCDLSFLNRLSVQNTKLLRFYMNWDPKIFHFFALIRYWGKYHNLTGSFLIKNYVLALLGLVFLCEMGLVPPLSLLQSLPASERRKKGCKNSNEIDGWDASFCEDLELVKNTFQAKPFPGEESDEQIVMNLALEFFKMYGSTDFSKIVVCPLIGKILPRDTFSRESNLPEDFKAYKDYIERSKDVKQAFSTKGHLCVQDPFVLNLNVAKSVRIGVVNKFKTACAKVDVAFTECKVTSLLDLFIPLPPYLEYAVDFELSDKFERVFLTDIYLHKKLGRNRDWDWSHVITTLYNRFISKFCKDFVFYSFRLKDKTQTRMVIQEEPLDEKKKDNRMCINSLLKTNTKGLYFKPAFAIETAFLQNKIEKCLQNFEYPRPSFVWHQKISVEVTYPFWKNRRAYFNDLKTEVMKSSKDFALKIPILPKKTKKEQLDKPLFFKCTNPFWLEGWTSQMVRLLHSEESKEDFKSFKVDIYISRHYGGRLSRPHIHFLFEKSEENGADVDEKNVELAISAIHNSIRYGLEDYVIFILANWIQSPNGSIKTCFDQVKKDEIWNNVLKKVKQSRKMMEGNANLDDDDEDGEDFSSESDDDEDDSEKEN